MPHFPKDQKDGPAKHGPQRDVSHWQGVFVLALLLAGLLISILVVRLIDPRSMRGSIGLTHALIAMPSWGGETV